jgi:hypothetical protein
MIISSTSMLMSILAEHIPIPKDLKNALENGLDYKKFAGIVDPDTYNMLHAAYWYGDWDYSKRKK